MSHRARTREVMDRAWIVGLFKMGFDTVDIADVIHGNPDREAWVWSDLARTDRQGEIGWGTASQRSSKV